MVKEDQSFFLIVAKYRSCDMVYAMLQQPHPSVYKQGSGLWVSFIEVRLATPKYFKEVKQVVWKM